MDGHLELEYALSVLADGDINGRFHGDASVIEGIFIRNKDSIDNALKELAKYIRENCDSQNNR